MMNKIFYLPIFFLLSFVINANAKVFISVIIDDEIITNVDLKKENNYLKILNPNLSQLNFENISKISKKSLIEERIKKKEIIKFIDFNQNDEIDQKLIKDLINKLNLTEIEFKNLLNQNKSYSIKEVKEKLRINIFWNDLIYFKFNKQIKIDEKELRKKIDALSSNEKKEYLISEIIFKKEKNKKLEVQVKEIKNSISGIGFNNTANIYSISDSAKFGGKIGWVDENKLSKLIINKIKDLKENQFTEVIQIGNNFMFLMVEKIKYSKVTIDKENEFKKMLQFEQNKQLNNFSKIYYNKAKINYDIKEK